MCVVMWVLASSAQLESVSVRRARARVRVRVCTSPRCSKGDDDDGDDDDVCVGGEREFETCSEFSVSRDTE